MSTLRRQAEMARNASIALNAVDTEWKNRALGMMADALLLDMDAILLANAKDIDNARAKGLNAAFIERLTLNEARIQAMADGLRALIQLPDPVGQLIDEWTRPNGLVIRKKRVPLGVIGIIFESRPNVTVDAAGLCLKSGNAAILRGGSDAIQSNIALMQSLQRAARESGLPDGTVSLVEDTSRETAKELMTLNGLIDCLIPRGGKGLIQTVVRESTVPVIQTGDGICHVYVDDPCDMQMARSIAVSAKVSRPSVCNSAETLLVHAGVAHDFLPGCLQELKDKGVEIRGCARVKAICPWVNDASDEDWDSEYNDLIYSVKIVDDLDEAIAFINQHGTRHSEAIITTDSAHGKRFQSMVDAAAVYVNVSTRFTDGVEFGFGAEIGISNQKLHARGPMGLVELTTTKYLIDGEGQVR